MLYLYMFHHAEWYWLFGENCTLGLKDEWSRYSQPNIPIGILYLFIGIVCELLYIPFMIAMARSEFIQYSCYKFMFLLGIIDMIILPSNSIVSGIQSIFGLNYCSNPKFFYVIGVVSTSGWYGAGMTCILLAINRFCEMLAPRVSKILFTGKQIYGLLTIPIVYLFYTFLHVAGVYNTNTYAFSFPFFGEHNWDVLKHVNLTFHCIHNILLVLILGFTYGTLCVVIGMQSRVLKRANISRLQKRMTLQSMCICLEMFFAAIVYVFNQFIPLPNLLLVVAHACWICVHGDTPIVYLILNKSLRRAVLELIGIKKPIRLGNFIINNSSFNKTTLKSENNVRKSSFAQGLLDVPRRDGRESRGSIYSIEPNN